MQAVRLKATERVHSHSGKIALSGPVLSCLLAAFKGHTTPTRGDKELIIWLLVSASALVGL